MIKGIERRSDFGVLRQFRSFCYRGVHNACINHLIAERRHRRIHKQLVYLAEDQETPEVDFLRAEVLQDIYKEVENLPDRARTIFKLLSSKACPPRRSVSAWGSILRLSGLRKLGRSARSARPC